MRKQLLTAALMLIAAGVGAQVKTKGFAVFEKGGHFQPYEFERHPMGDDEIEIKILYAGICHSDLHNVAEDWGRMEYPMVPGHEIVGQVMYLLTVVVIGLAMGSTAISPRPASAAPSAATCGFT